MKNPRKKAIAYLRTSSATNCGTDKVSEHRQRREIEAFAKRAGYEIVGKFYDAAVSGADHIDTRPGFAAMLERIEGNGARTIFVETANRFARDLMVQEVGYAKLRERGIDLIAADNPSSFLDDGPTSKLVRQVLGAIAEFDKAMTVAKLRGARERKRKELPELAPDKPLSWQPPATSTSVGSLTLRSRSRPCLRSETAGHLGPRGPQRALPAPHKRGGGPDGGLRRKGPQRRRGPEKEICYVFDRREGMARRPSRAARTISTGEETQ
jgi:DNA invertase Pin-like site-specific DNA recombinase